MELAVGNLYRLEELPRPDLVIDGGANTGLFTLAAAARWPTARLRVCEPVPHNLAIVDEHLRINSVQADLLPVALGAAPGRAKFYCRQANQGSFDPHEPFHSVIEVPVATLSELCDNSTAGATVIKLDIEGAEVAVLSEFLQEPRRRTAVIGELHQQRTRKPEVMDLLKASGWRGYFFQEDDKNSQFHFFSPDLAGVGAGHA
jgi:FkbM family methyltransferase